MKLFHWKSQQVELFVMAESESEARSFLVESVNSWRWQNPARFDAILADLDGSPYFIAEPGHVVTIDTEK